VTKRRPDDSGGDAPGSLGASGAEASATRVFAEARSVAELREAILRRIMRAACVVGAVAMGLAILFVRPFEIGAAIVGGGALAVVFASTLLPRRLTVLSLVYPWVLALTGSGLGLTVGPKPEPFLFLCGGLFIGSLVLEKTKLVLLACTTLVATCAAIYVSEEGFAPAPESAWLNGLTSMLSVALPASIAGRMLVNALASALDERTALVRDLLEVACANAPHKRSRRRARSSRMHRKWSSSVKWRAASRTT
jgi:hypothetical protein